MSRYYMLEVVLLLIAAISKVEMKCSNNLLMCLEMSCEELTDENIEKNIEKINNLDNNGKAALHYAVYAGDLRCVNKLMEYGADPNIKSIDGETPLHMVYGESWSCERCALALLEGGANQSLTNNKGETPIFNFNLYKCPRCMHTLIQWGGDVDAKDADGDTPLCRLVEEVDEETVRDVYMPYLNTLMKLCADPNIRCMEGMTAREKAEEYEQEHNIKVLKDYAEKSQCRRNEAKDGKECVCKNGHLQWDLSKSGYPNLGQECNVETLRTLILQDDMDINSTDTSGHTPLMKAVMNQQQECVEVILNNADNVNHRDKKGKNALWFALMNCASCSENGILQMMLNNGANLYDRHGCSLLLDKNLVMCDECIAMLCKHGLDPLKECVDRGNPMLHICKEDVYMKPLIKHCSLATIKSKTSNKTALWYALKNCGSCRKAYCVHKLLKNGAKAEDYTTEQGCSIIMDSDLDICDQCVRLLYKYGYNVDAHTKTCTEGGNALIWWCGNSNRNIDVLLETCPNVDYKDEKGKTAMDISRQTENEECIKSIEGYKKRSQCTFENEKEMQCDGKLHKCECRNSTTMWNPPLVGECWIVHKNYKKEKNNKNHKKEKKEEDNKYKDALLQEKSHSSGVGCGVVDGKHILEGKNWLEDCWLYQCKEGRIIHTLNPSCKYHQQQLSLLMNNNRVRPKFTPLVAQSPQKIIQQGTPLPQSTPSVVQTLQNMIQQGSPWTQSTPLVVQSSQQIIQQDSPLPLSAPLIVQSPQQMIQQGSLWPQFTPLVVQSPQNMIQQGSPWPQFTPLVVQSPQNMIQQGSPWPQYTPLVGQSPQKIIQQGIPLPQSNPSVVQAPKKLMLQDPPLPQSTLMMVQSPQKLMQVGSPWPQSTPFVVQTHLRLMQQSPQWPQSTLLAVKLAQELMIDDSTQPISTQLLVQSPQRLIQHDNPQPQSIPLTMQSPHSNTRVGQLHRQLLQLSPQLAQLSQWQKSPHKLMQQIPLQSLDCSCLLQLFQQMMQMTICG